MLACNQYLKRSNIFRLRALVLLRPFSDLKSRNPQNQGIVDLLQRYKDEESSKPVPNTFKVHAFNSAIWTVMKIEWPIRSGKDVLTLTGIGPGITSRINEHLRKLYEEDTERDREAHQEVAKVHTAEIFNTIPGLGPTKIKALVEAGCLSLDDLTSSKFSSMLSQKTQLQVKYLNHLQQPVSRLDAEEVLAFCRETLDSNYSTVLVGEYRRGLENLKDIRIMISHPDVVHVPMPKHQPFDENPPAKKTATKEQKPKKRRDEKIRTNLLQNDLVPLLKFQGLVSDTLEFNSTSWQGVIRLPGFSGEQGSRQDRAFAIENLAGQYRKLYIHLVPQKSIGSALLALTGDSEFEKDLHRAAQKRGMLFNEYGVWKWNAIHKELRSSSTAQRASEIPDIDAETGVGGSCEEPASGGYWSLMKSSSEEDIFQVLGMDFVEPTRRNFSILFGRTRKRRSVSQPSP